MTDTLHDQVNRSLRAAGVSVERARSAKTNTLKDQRDGGTSGAGDKIAETAGATVPDHFKEPEEGSYEVVVKHAQEKEYEKRTRARDRKVKVAMLGLLTAADSIAAIQSRRRELS